MLAQMSKGPRQLPGRGRESGSTGPRGCSAEHRRWLNPTERRAVRVSAVGSSALRHPSVAESSPPPAETVDVTAAPHSASPRGESQEHPGWGTTGHDSDASSAANHPVAGERDDSSSLSFPIWKEKMPKKTSTSKVHRENEKLGAKCLARGLPRSNVRQAGQHPHPAARPASQPRLPKAMPGRQTYGLAF